MTSSYLKFDLTRESLALFPELAAIAKREGAIQASLVVSTEKHSKANQIALASAADYVAIKIPSIEGTEIWLVAREDQESVEKTVGFETVSKPLLVFQSDQLDRLTASDPQQDEKVFSILVSNDRGSIV